jgi:hypothetical protein
MIVAYITDAREEYARTVFQELGLPAGARVKLRYSYSWIQPPLRDHLYANRLVGRDVLICYMDGNHGDLSTAKTVACRYGQLTKSERISDFISMECALGGFPSSAKVSDLFAAADGIGLLNPGPRSGFFVINADISDDEQLQDASADRWSSVVERMTECSFFGTASFLYFESFIRARGQNVACESGAFRFKAGAMVRARIHTFAVTNESRLHHYELRTDDSAVEAIDGSVISLTFGREVFDVRLLTLPTERSRPSRIIVEPGPAENGSAFTISIDIVARRLAATVRRLAIASSGAAAATAGILPSTVPLVARIALVVVGSIGLGLSAKPSS